MIYLLTTAFIIVMYQLVKIEDEKNERRETKDVR